MLLKDIHFTLNHQVDLLKVHSDKLLSDAYLLLILFVRKYKYSEAHYTKRIIFYTLIVTI